MREGLLLLRSFMESWLALLQEQRLSGSLIDPAAGGGAAAGGSHSSSISSSHSSGHRGGGPVAGGGPGLAGAAASAPDPASLALDLHKLEGVLFTLLCSHNEGVRCEAYGLLHLLRTLHQQLCVAAEQWGVPPGGGSGAAQQHQQQQAVASPGGSSGVPVGASFSSSVHASGAFGDGSAPLAAAGAPSRDSAELLRPFGACSCARARRPSRASPPRRTAQA